MPAARKLSVLAASLQLSQLEICDRQLLQQASTFAPEVATTPYPLFTLRNTDNNKETTSIPPISDHHTGHKLRRATMVLLTMTPSILEVLALETPKRQQPAQTDDETTGSSQVGAEEPSLKNPSVGNPISHSQIVDLWRNLKSQGDSAPSLEQLLRGASVYVPPPPPKPEPVRIPNTLPPGPQLIRA